MKKQGSRIRKSKGSRVPGFQDSSEFNALDPSTPRILESFRSSRGFTAIEATMIVVVLAILAVSIIVKNPFSTQDYATIAADQLIADIQYVQMRAMGIGSQQSISFTSGSGAYTVAGEQKNLPGDIQIVSTNFGAYGNQLKFNSLGEPFVGTNTSCTSLTGGNCTINLASRSITVYAITGKVE